MARNRTAGRVVSAPSYRVLAGLSWDGGRAEAGEVRDDIPAASVPWLLDRGYIEPAETTEGGDG